MTSRVRSSVYLHPYHNVSQESYISDFPGKKLSQKLTKKQPRFTTIKILTVSVTSVKRMIFFHCSHIFTYLRYALNSLLSIKLIIYTSIRTTEPSKEIIWDYFYKVCHIIFSSQGPLSQLCVNAAPMVIHII